MKHFQLLQEAKKALQEENVPSQELAWFLKDAFSISWERLYGSFKNSLDVSKAVRLFVSLKYRHIPLAYLTGLTNFFGLTLQVKPGVFIPRVETEKLVEVVLSQLDGKGLILDVGTGCGAIALALASQVENFKVFGLDISKKAVLLSQENAERLGFSSKVEFLEGDVFTYQPGKKCNVVVSNPPYIPSWQLPFLPEEVSWFELEKALDGGEDGLKFYRRLVQLALVLLEDSGIMAVEIGFGQAFEVKKLFEKVFEQVEVFLDYQGRERVVLGKELR